MVQGVEVDLFRPDEELRKLSKLALELKLTDIISSNSLDEALVALGASAQVKQWIEAWAGDKNPRFNFTNADAFSSANK